MIIIIKIKQHKHSKLLETNVDKFFLSKINLNNYKKVFNLSSLSNFKSDKEKEILVLNSKNRAYGSDDALILTKIMTEIEKKARSQPINKKNIDKLILSNGTLSFDNKFVVDPQRSIIETEPVYFTNSFGNSITDYNKQARNISQKIGSCLINSTYNLSTQVSQNSKYKPVSINIIKKKSKNNLSDRDDILNYTISNSIDYSKIKNNKVKNFISFIDENEKNAQILLLAMNSKINFYKKNDNVNNTGKDRISNHTLKYNLDKKNKFKLKLTSNIKIKKIESKDQIFINKIDNLVNKLKNPIYSAKENIKNILN